METNTTTSHRIASSADLTPHMLRMMFDEPFFASVLRGVNVEFGEAIPTAGVMEIGRAHV